jgi:hypothetical protein
MQYLNPFKLFKVDSKEVDDKSIELIRNQIENEYNQYSKYDYITYNGTKLQIQELKFCLNELLDEAIREYHIQILKDTELYNFIEFGHPDILKNRKELNGNPDYIDFVVPYFANQISEILLQGIKTEDQQLVDLVLDFKLPLLEIHENLYFENTADYLKNYTVDFDIEDDNSRWRVMSEREIISTISDRLIKIINTLPNYFDDSRNQMALELKEFSEELSAKFGRADASLAILKQALKLKISAEVKNEIRSLNKQISPGLNKLPLFLIIGMSVVALLFLLKWVENSFF